MRAYQNIKVRAASLAAVTMIINIFCLGNVQAQNTRAYCLPAVLEATSQAFPALDGVQMNAAQAEFFKAYSSEETPQWIKAMKDSGALEGKAGSGAAINEWLKTKGFWVRPSGDRSVAAVFDLKLAWEVPGAASETKVGDDMFAAAKMSFDKLGGVHSSPKHDKPVFEMKPLSQDWEIFITEYQGEISEDKELLSLGNEVLTDLKPSEISGKFSAVIIPKVAFEKEIDISFLEGMASPAFSVDEALKFVKLNLSEAGIEASSAVVFRTRGMAPPAYAIKEKFMVIIRTKGTSPFPAFVALCDKDSWVKAK